MVTLVPVGPEIPAVAQPLLKSHEDALRELQQPTQPSNLFAVAQAGLPLAKDYPQTLVLVTDLNILAHSDGLNWIRSDTGAAI